MTVQCCVCRKYRVKDHWEKDVKIEAKISHTYYPACKQQAMKSIVKDMKASAVAE
jgi:hypothetical protein